MKKYSSYKSIKPSHNGNSNYALRNPQSPNHSSSYRKVNAIDVSAAQYPERSQIYTPMSAKYSNYINYNTNSNTGTSNRKKMFSSKNNNERSLKVLALNGKNQVSNHQQSFQTVNGLGNIKNKIDSLESRLNQIKRNYDVSYQNRKGGSSANNSVNAAANKTSASHHNPKHHDSSASKSKITSGKSNKQNETPKDPRKTSSSSQSRLLLERHHISTQKKLSKGPYSSSSSNTNFNPVQPKGKQLTLTTGTSDHSRPPMNPNSPKNTLVIIRQAQKNSTFSDENKSKVGNDYGIQRQNKTIQKKQKNQRNQKMQRNQRNDSSQQRQTPSVAKEVPRSSKLRNSSISVTNKNQSVPDSSLKDYVTTFTCGGNQGTQTLSKVEHYNSEKNLYKAQNKLTAKNTSGKMKYYVSAIIQAYQTNSPTSFDALCRNHMSTSLEILTYIKNVKKTPPAKVSARPLPPVKDNRHTIIFDLDQTLIHCNQNVNMPHDVALPIKFPNGAMMKAGINVRPFARECIKQLAKYFEIIVFTASHQCYGNVICDYIDPKQEFIAHRFFRDSCHKTDQGFYIKDLRVVDRDLSKVLLIDNVNSFITFLQAAYSYCFQLDNGIPVVPFYDNKADMQLKNLIPYLKQFLKVKDVRGLNSSQMRLHQYTNFKDVKNLVSKLYLKD